MDFYDVYKESSVYYYYPLILSYVFYDRVAFGDNSFLKIASSDPHSGVRFDDKSLIIVTYKEKLVSFLSYIQGEWEWNIRDDAEQNYAEEAFSIVFEENGVIINVDEKSYVFEKNGSKSFGYICQLNQENYIETYLSIGRDNLFFISVVDFKNGLFSESEKMTISFRSDKFAVLNYNGAFGKNGEIHLKKIP